MLTRSTGVTVQREPRTSARATAVVWLVTLVGTLALVAAGVGVFARGGAPLAFTTVRGTTAMLHGTGIYRYDSLFLGAGTRGQDIVTLLLGVPLLAVTTLWYRRGSMRGALLLLGVLTYFVYCYATLSLGIAYNALFLLYIALFGASLYAIVLVVRAILARGLAAALGPGIPRRAPAVFLWVSGVVTSFVWLSPVVVALATGDAPARMDSSTTLVTTALDMAIIVPSLFVAGGLIWRRNALGYLLATAQLCLILMIGPVIAASTVMQLRAGVQFSVPEIVGPLGGFGAIALVAAWVLTGLLRRIDDAPAAPGGGSIG